MKPYKCGPSSCSLEIHSFADRHRIDTEAARPSATPPPPLLVHPTTKMFSDSAGLSPEHHRSSKRGKGLSNQLPENQTGVHYEICTVDPALCKTAQSEQPQVGTINRMLVKGLQSVPNTVTHNENGSRRNREDRCGQRGMGGRQDGETFLVGLAGSMTSMVHGCLLHPMPENYIRFPTRRGALRRGCVPFRAVFTCSKYSRFRIRFSRIDKERVPRNVERMRKMCMTCCTTQKRTIGGAVDSLHLIRVGGALNSFHTGEPRVECTNTAREEITKVYPHPPSGGTCPPAPPPSQCERFYSPPLPPPPPPCYLHLWTNPFDTLREYQRLGPHCFGVNPTPCRVYIL